MAIGTVKKLAKCNKPKTNVYQIINNENGEEAEFNPTDC